MKGSSRVGGVLDWKRRLGGCGCGCNCVCGRGRVRCVQKMHGVVVWRVRSFGMVEWEGVGVRSLRAAVERMDRMFVIAVLCVLSCSASGV